MLIAGIGIFAGLTLVIKKPASATGGSMVLITGLMPVLTLYDVIHTIVVYGNEYIAFPLSLIFLSLLIVPMVLSSTGGVLVLRGHHSS